PRTTAWRWTGRTRPPRTRRRRCRWRAPSAPGSPRSGPWSLGSCTRRRCAGTPRTRPRWRRTSGARAARRPWSGAGRSPGEREADQAPVALEGGGGVSREARSAHRKAVVAVAGLLQVGAVLGAVDLGLAHGDLGLDLLAVGEHERHDDVLAGQELLGEPFEEDAVAVLHAAVEPDEGAGGELD